MKKMIRTAALAAAVLCLFGCGAGNVDDTRLPLPPDPSGPENASVPGISDDPAVLEDVETAVPDDRYELHTKEEPPEDGKKVPPEKQDEHPEKQEQPSEHEHVWEPVTEIRRVEDRPARDEKVLVREAWTETVDEYSTVTHQVCGDCGAYMDELSEAERSAHIKAHVMSGGSGSHYTKQFREKTGERVIEHPAEYRMVHYEAEWHEETVITGWRCSCGAVR
ncbi:MAG: hypothetical protein IJM80_07640 [Firmicutes bacterium]|nr:hypothetical protein [Bacillota bacterium]